MDRLRKCLKFRFFESLLSYYAFFTLLLAEVAMLIRDKPTNMYGLFGVLAAYYVAILAFSLLIGLKEGTKGVRCFTAIYIGTFLVICGIGCILNLKYTLIMTALLIGVSFFYDKLRWCQTFECDSEKHPVQTFFARIFKTRAFYLTSQCILVFGSYALLGLFWLPNESVNILVRLGVYGAYGIILPIFGIFEDNSQNAERYEAASREALERYRKEARGKYSDKY